MNERKNIITCFIYLLELSRMTVIALHREFEKYLECSD